MIDTREELKLECEEALATYNRTKNIADFEYYDNKLRELIEWNEYVSQ